MFTTTDAKAAVLEVLTENPAGLDLHHINRHVRDRLNTLGMADVAVLDVIAEAEINLATDRQILPVGRSVNSPLSIWGINPKELI